MKYLLVVALLSWTVPALAQQPPPPQPSSDFLFGAPRGSFGLRGGWLFAHAGGELFGFISDRLTVDKGDFNAPFISTDIGFTLTPRVDIVGGVDLSRTSASSEYRHFAENGRPIRQTTYLQEQNLTASVRVALLPRGLAISRLAWVPRRVTPVVGAGAGMMHYALRQAGDFVDEDRAAGLAIFTDSLESNGWAPSAHLFGGVDLRIYRGLMLSVEGRYLWSKGPVREDFVGFEPIDLAGFRLSTGINVLF
jgi:hypothetical protein